MHTIVIRRLTVVSIHRYYEPYMYTYLVLPWPMGYARMAQLCVLCSRCLACCQEAGWRDTVLYLRFGELPEMPGATPEFFFAPGHLQSRSKELGPAEFMMRLGGAYIAFRQYCDEWMRVEYSQGSDAVESAYQKVLAGQADPAAGQIISLI